MVKERIYLPSSEKREKPLGVSRKQFLQIACFFPDKKKPDENNQLGAFNGFLEDFEKEIFLTNLANFGNENTIYLPSRRGDYLPSLLKELNTPPALAKKICSHWRLDILSTANTAKVKKFFKGLKDNGKQLRENDNFSLPIKLLLLSLNDTERQTVLKFLEDGGVLSLLSAKKPTKKFVEMVDSLSFDTMQEKIRYVFSPEGKGNKIIEEVSHQFMNVSLANESNWSEDIFNIQIKIADVLDRKVEADFSRIILLKALMGLEMKEVKIALGSSAALASLFYLIDQIAIQKTNNENIYFAFNNLVKIITHGWANLIDFYAQYKFLINGKNFFKELRSLFQQIGWKGGLIFLQGMILDILSEIVGKNDSFMGSVIFGLEPAAGTWATTFLAYKSSNNKNNHEKLFFTDKVKRLLENPAVLGMDIAVFLTFLTSVGLLGLKGEFHNPLAVVGVGALSEPLYASLITTLIERKKAREEEVNLINKLITN